MEALYDRKLVALLVWFGASLLLRPVISRIAYPEVVGILDEKVWILVLSPESRLFHPVSLEKQW